ncbi:MAG: phospholipid carrier-dependent glycosyltransferase [Armatimonadota bacterium]|nr:phospholipid carrier-dependent glycosyltransferase [Armatimonadota bacterium]MDR7520311.1 phospholipid carrier-dependent glycosyltransferase [Armatimonadota bacterium]
MTAGVDLATAGPAQVGPAPVARRADRAAVLVVVGLTLFAALVRLPRLHTPASMIFDEIYYAKAAQQYLARKEITEERTHPPLSKLIIAAGIALAGDDAVGWRIASAIAGTLLVPVIYALAATLFQNRFVAAASALLVAADGLVLVESRIAKPDIFLTLFLFGAYAAFWQYLRGRLDRPEGPPGRGVGWLYLAGAAAGCAVATKWTTVVPLAIIPVTLAVLRGWGRVALPRRDLRHMVAAFTALPVAVYLLSYIPYFTLGHSARDFIAHQASMYQFHASLTEGHPYQSAWWSWPLLIRPIWYEYYEAAPQWNRGILAIGNPVIWWASLPAFALVAAHAVRTRAVPETFLLIGFAVSYVQYAFITRALFLYHFLPALPFLIVSLAVALARVRGRVGSGPVFLYLLLALGWLVAFYPVLAAVTMPAQRIMHLMWFGTWI